MQEDYDYLLIIAGDAGDGKSRLALQLFETWYRVILKKPVTEDMIFQVNQDYRKWLQAFKKMMPYDMNIFDEGARSLDSKASLTRVSRDLNKLYNVFRCKRFFTVVIMPKYFRLNKELREDRLRGLVWVHKRGAYKLFTKEGIKYLNGYNERRVIKSMFVARPFHCNTFPDYHGVLLKKYLAQKEKGVDEVLDSVIWSSEVRLNRTLVQKFSGEVTAMVKKGKKESEIIEKLGISKGTLHRCLVFSQ